MLLALPGYQFPYIVMNRCLYLRWPLCSGNALRWDWRACAWKSHNARSPRAFPYTRCHYAMWILFLAYLLHATILPLIARLISSLSSLKNKSSLKHLSKLLDISPFEIAHMKMHSRSKRLHILQNKENHYLISNKLGIGIGLAWASRNFTPTNHHV